MIKQIFIKRYIDLRSPITKIYNMWCVCKDIKLLLCMWESCAKSNTQILNLILTASIAHVVRVTPQNDCMYQTSNVHTSLYPNHINLSHTKCCCWWVSCNIAALNRLHIVEVRFPLPLLDSPAVFPAIWSHTVATSARPTLLIPSKTNLRCKRCNKFNSEPAIFQLFK